MANRITDFWPPTADPMTSDDHAWYDDVERAYNAGVEDGIAYERIHRQFSRSVVGDMLFGMIIGMLVGLMMGLGAN